MMRLDIGLTNPCRRGIGLLDNKIFPIMKCRGLKVYVIAIVLIYTIYSMLHHPTKFQNESSQIEIHNFQWTVLEKQEVFDIQMVSDDCFEHIPVTIEEFSTVWKNMKKTKLKNCDEFKNKFEYIYEFEERFSKSMFVPPLFQYKLKLSLNKEDYKLISNQKIISVFNKLTFEQTAFNPLRSRRPLPKEVESIWQYVNSLASESKRDCDFCNYMEKTASDQFGRSETPFTVRMSNSFKMDRWHGMVITKSHHPLNLSADVFEAMLEDSYKWSREVQHTDPTYLYPNLGMDLLPKAGSSQLHPHIHILMAPNHYYGSMEMLRSVSFKYLQQTKRNYFNDLVQLYSTIGLAVKYKSAIALSMLTGKGDMEILIMSELPNKDLYHLFYFVTKAYRDTFQQICYSASMAWPPVVSSDKQFEMPALIRIISRGNCMTKINDISYFDLFLMNSRTHDPWEVARAIQKSVDA